MIRDFADFDDGATLAAGYFALWVAERQESHWRGSL